MEYICNFNGSMDENGVLDLVVGITVPITTLCPCSKEISQVGAHNQRGEVTTPGHATILLPSREHGPDVQ
jgi:GTP cyclohydrolase I